MIKVLQVVGDLNYSGIPVVIMNYYRNIDRQQIQFDFITTNKNGRFEQEIKELGGKVFYLPPKFRHPFKYMKGLRKIIKENKYDIVHSNTNSASAYLDLLPAKQAGCKIRIAHSHNSSCNIKWQHYIFKPLLPTVANARFACSQEAGKWMFGKKPFVQINNGIDFDKYSYNEQTRKAVREKMGWNDCFVLGHVGSFQIRKNQRFLVEAMPEILKAIPMAKLVLVGTGETMEDIKSLVREKGLENNVEFLGNRPDIPELLQAFDVFCFPSLSEGLAVAFLEACASSLPVVMNEDIPYVDIGDVKRLPLNKTDWIETLKKIREENIRTSLDRDSIEKSGYDIRQNAKILCEYYKNLLSKQV